MWCSGLFPPPPNATIDICGNTPWGLDSSNRDCQLQKPFLAATQLCNTWFVHIHWVVEHLTTLVNAFSLPQTPQLHFVFYLPAYPRPMTSSCMGLSPSNSVRVVFQLLSQPSAIHPSLCTQCSPAPSLSSSCQLPSPSTNTLCTFPSRCIESIKANLLLSPLLLSL